MRAADITARNLGDTVTLPASGLWPEVSGRLTGVLQSQRVTVLYLDVRDADVHRLEPIAEVLIHTGRLKCRSESSSQ